MRKWFIPLFLLLVLGLFATVKAQPYSYDYAIYKDGDFWIGSYGINGTICSNNTAFVDTFAEVQTLAVAGDRLDVLGNVETDETIQITKNFNIAFKDLTITTDNPAICINSSLAPVASLSVEYLHHNNLYSNSTPVLLLVDSAYWTINIGWLYKAGSDFQGIGVMLYANTSQKCYGNTITIRDIHDCHTALKLLAEGTGWIGENSFYDSSFWGYCAINITNAGTGSIHANDFIDSGMSTCQIGIDLSGAVAQTTFYVFRAWDWGQSPFTDSPLVYRADSEVVGTSFIDCMVRTERTDYWADNGTETLYIDYVHTGEWAFQGFPTPDPTTAPTESTDDKSLLVEFVIVLAIVGILGGAIGLRRYY